MDYDDIEMMKDEDTGDIVFNAVKKAKTRNLEGEIVETETRQEVCRLPDNRDVGLEIGKQLCGKYAQHPRPEGKSITQKMDEAYDR